MCVDTACAPTPQNPTRFVTFPGKIFAKSQKHKKLKKLKSVRLLEFFDFFDSSTFRAEIHWNVNFSTFRLSAGENRDFHGVTATCQMSSQRKLTQTHIDPSRPTTEFLPHPPRWSLYLFRHQCSSSCHQFFFPETLTWHEPSHMRVTHDGGTKMRPAVDHPKSGMVFHNYVLFMFIQSFSQRTKK
jgi:hypothetical protein